MADPCFMSAAAIASAIRRGRMSSLEATKAHLGRIAARNPGLDALVIVDGERALAAARAADRSLRRGRAAGPLHGVPITIKEAFDVAGLHTTSSWTPLVGNVASHDAGAVARLRAAGAVILGKTNVPELCMDVQCAGPVYPEARNPWDPARTPGGSTGGGGAAVAARLSPLELGSDIGGSVRNPAHFNGVWGLKTTEGRVSGAGHVPDIPGLPRTNRWMGTFGFLARTPGDLALALSVCAGADAADVDTPPVPVGRVPAVDLAGARFAFTPRHDVAPVCSDTTAALDGFVRLLGAAGAKVSRGWPEGLDAIRAWETWSDLLQTMSRALDPLERRERLLLHAGSDDPSRRSVARAARLDMAAFMRTLAARDAAIRACEAFVGDLDGWIMPVMPFPAFTRRKAGEPLEIDGVPHPYWQAGTAYNFLANLTGQPSLVVPVGLSKGGLPIGVQIVGRRWGEARLLGVGRALEKLLPPCPAPPAFAA